MWQLTFLARANWPGEGGKVINYTHKVSPAQINCKKLLLLCMLLTYSLSFTNYTTQICRGNWTLFFLLLFASLVDMSHSLWLQANWEINRTNNVSNTHTHMEICTGITMDLPIMFYSQAKLHTAHPHGIITTHVANYIGSCNSPCL